MWHSHRTINCKGRLCPLHRPVVMGILNVTPDSFYDGGRHFVVEAAISQALRMYEEGATILDVGGMSSRPGAEELPVAEEIRRVIPVIQAISERIPEAIISVDTVQPEVARLAVEAGASIVNDISAGRMVPGMYETVAALDVPYVLMHMKGTPKTMQKEAVYENVVEAVLEFLLDEVGKLKSLGIKDIIIDPGFGFGKTIAHNFQLLQYLHTLKILPYPILAGISRKSMIYRTLGITPEEALNGTTALNMVALQQGASILRVHDVRQAVETIKIFEALENHQALP
jgi:dihydropteroate synthase